MNRAGAATLRVARRDDISAMHRVRMAVRENQLTSAVITEADYIDVLERRGCGWVIETPPAEGSRIVAFAFGDAGDGNIWALFVHPDHERRGHGRRLHDAMVQWLWSRGLQRLWLSTTPATRAQHFYEAAGWRCTAPAPRGELRYELRRPDDRCT